MGILMMDSMGWPYDSFDCLSLLLDPIGSQYIRAISVTLNVYLYVPHVENQI
jgi:hypothetical protein